MESVTSSAPVASHRLSQIAFHNPPDTPFLRWFANGLKRRLLREGHREVAFGDGADLVLNFTDAKRPRPYRRNAQATFVVGVVEVDENPGDGPGDGPANSRGDLLKAAYPVLVKSLSNLLVYVIHTPTGSETYFITLEQGYYTARATQGDSYFDEVYHRIAPLASSRLVINNIFQETLPAALRKGNPTTDALVAAGRRLEAMNLLPSPFPLDDILSPRDLAHVNRLFGIGGLSYGNLSSRHDESAFWMSARGVNKAEMADIGRDIVLITDYDAAQDAMVVQVPPGITPRGASVDAIEHWALYQEHPDIGAIIHIHAWMRGVSSTTVNYPCGTYELAQEVASHVRRCADPGRAVIGLKNHGLTITGHSLDDIFTRIDGEILPQVPME